MRDYNKLKISHPWKNKFLLLLKKINLFVEKLEKHRRIKRKKNAITQRKQGWFVSVMYIFLGYCIILCILKKYVHNIYREKNFDKNSIITCPFKNHLNFNSWGPNVISLLWKARPVVWFLHVNEGSLSAGGHPGREPLGRGAGAE